VNRDANGDYHPAEKDLPNSFIQKSRQLLNITAAATLKRNALLSVILFSTRVKNVIRLSPSDFKGFFFFFLFILIIHVLCFDF